MEEEEEEEAFQPLSPCLCNVAAAVAVFPALAGFATQQREFIASLWNASSPRVLARRYEGIPKDDDAVALAEEEDEDEEEDELRSHKKTSPETDPPARSEGQVG